MKKEVFMKKEVYMKASVVIVTVFVVFAVCCCFCQNALAQEAQAQNEEAYVLPVTEGTEADAKETAEADAEAEAEADARADDAVPEEMAQYEPGINYPDVEAANMEAKDSDGEMAPSGDSIEAAANKVKNATSGATVVCNFTGPAAILCLPVVAANVVASGVELISRKSRTPSYPEETPGGKEPAAIVDPQLLYELPQYEPPLEVADIPAEPGMLEGAGGPSPEATKTPTEMDEKPKPEKSFWGWFFSLM